MERGSQPDNDNEYFRFVNLLALELQNGDISLPSLPDVVIKVRDMLENEDCDFDQVSKAVSLDAVLVSKLLVYANSALYNRAGVQIEQLDAAIGRLGFEVIRNTAMSIALQQLYDAEKHSHYRKHTQQIWARSMKLSCMAHAVAGCQKLVNEETAFLCGLMHEVGKLYILTKASDFPGFLGDPASLQTVLGEWNPQITKSIIEAWGFSEDIAISADPEHHLDEGAGQASPADVMFVARMIVDGHDDDQDFDDVRSCKKLGISRASLPGVMQGYKDRLQTMQQSLA